MMIIVQALDICNKKIREKDNGFNGHIIISNFDSNESINPHLQTTLILNKSVEGVSSHIQAI
jgi:predicted aspartyl protease